MTRNRSLWISGVSRFADPVLVAGERNRLRAEARRATDRRMRELHSNEWEKICAGETAVRMEWLDRQIARAEDLAQRAEAR